MKQNKKMIVISIIILIVALLMPLLIILSKNNQKDKQGKTEGNNIVNNEIINEVSENNSHDEEMVNNLKEDYGLTGETDIYEIKQEIDGSNVLAVKAGIKYKVAFSRNDKKIKT